MLKFYGRRNELKFLSELDVKSCESARMTFVIGRRRIGKTSLLIKGYEKKDVLYFFVSKKNEALLCSEYIAEIENKLSVPTFGSFANFKDVFAYLIELSKTRHFTLIIDEFQEFSNVNRSIYSDMQKIWDLNKNESKINLILCGSVYSLMHKIFESSKEPLFGRATGNLSLRPFDIPTIKTILADYNPSYKAEDLLALYLLTGGVAKYIEIFMLEKAFSHEKMLNLFFSGNSLFLDEGRNVLIDEFGKDYGNYFSILTLIASSKTSRSEIESILNIETGGFLAKLENDFSLINKNRPILASTSSRSIKYKITDNFLNFWFRFVYKNRSAVEMRNFDYLKEIVKRDYSTYSGAILERYFTQKLAAEGNFSQIGAYWEGDGKNEIDIVAINEYEKRALICEVKRQKKNLSIEVLKNKSVNLVRELKDYKIAFKGLSMDDM